jgi:16S rRNA (guanine527-N7)-methyltransferase
VIEEKLIQGLNALGCTLDAVKLQKLVQYVQLLNKWNKAFNLTAVRRPEEMVSRHIIDSLSTLPYITGESIIDVGTGPGLPGIPLAICFPEKEIFLLDSNIKKTRFLTQCRLELDLATVKVVHARADEFIPVKKFDLVISRAFAPLKNIIGWCEHLITDKGVFLAMKGPFPADELAELPAGFHLQESIAVKIPGSDAERHLLIIAKC